ncbi:MAG: universal stress protein [Halanaerobiaceae bacterium]
MSASDDKNFKGYKKLLLPLGHRADVNNLTLLTSMLINRDRGLVEFMHVIEEGSYSRLPGEWRTGSKRVTESHHRMMKMGINSKRQILTASSIIGGILKEVEKEEADGLVLGWGPKPKSSISSLVSKILEKAPCDVMVYKTRSDPREVKSIMYPVAKIPDASRLQLISHIVNRTGAKLTFVHVIKNSKQEDTARSRLENSLSRAENFNLEANTQLLQGDSISGEIAEASKDYDLMVVGPSRGWWLRETLFGRMTDKIAAKADCSVLLHKAADE